MQKYKYEAVDINKKKFKGLFLAENENDLRVQLARESLYLVKCKSISDKSPSVFLAVSSRVKISEITTFCRQFAIMINAGISILNCMDTLKNQSYSALFRKVLNAVYEDIKSGELLSDALKKHKKVFPEFFVSMCYVGEMSGKLDEILNRLAAYYENDNAIRRKAKSAMIYPALLLVLTLGVLVLMLTVVVPMFQDALLKMNTTLPPITQFLFNASTWFQENYLMVFAVIAVLILLLFVFSRTNRGKLAFGWLKVSFPLVGGVNSALVASRFTSGFGVLLSSGMPIVDALEVMSNLLGNKYVEKKFQEAIDQVKRGVPLALAFEDKGIFPAILIQMISVGERTGSLDEVLLRTSGFFDEQVGAALNRLTTMLGPLMIIIMGIVIVFVILAVYTPMLSMIDTLG